MSLNPFVFFEPVKGPDFSNREEIIHEISRITFQSKQQGNVWVVGERQVGKTSLLQRIERLYQDDHPIISLYGTDQEFKVLFIYFNCQIIRESNGFYQNLTQCFANQFDFKIEEKDNPYASFITWLKHIYERKYYIVFLLDEFDAFIEKFTRGSADDSAHFLDTFNVLKQEIPGLKDKQKAFGVVCASNCTFGELTENMELSGSGLTFVQEIELPNFTEKQVFDMASQYLERNQIQFSKSEIQFCYKMTHGYPLFVQHLFSIMYEEKTKKPDGSDNDFLKVVKSEYGKAFKKTVEDWEKQKKLPNRTKQKLKNILKETKDDMKDVASAVITKIIEGS